MSPQRSSKSKENKSPSSFVTVISKNDDESDEFAPATKKIRSPTFQTKKKLGHETSPGDAKKHVLGTSKDAGIKLGSDGQKSDEPLVVPETQFFFTPENKSKTNDRKVGEPNKATPDGKSPSSGTEFGIIPDTPENNDSGVKPKRPLGRSFLLSATSLASNPIQKAKENRQAKVALKKKMALARKSSGTAISVEFNKERHIGRESDLKSESFVKQSFTDSSISLPDTKSDSKLRLIITPEKLEIDTVVEDITPTKHYAGSESLTVKRMAKPGISPLSKRTDAEKSSIHEANAANKIDSVRILSFDARTNDSAERLDAGMNQTNHKSFDVKTIQDDIERKVTCASSSVRSDFVPASEVEPEPFSDVIEFERHKQERNKLKKEKLEKRRLEMLQEKRKKSKEERKKNHEKLLTYQLAGDIRSNKGQAFRSEGAAMVDGVDHDEALEDLLLELNSPSLLKCNSGSKTVRHNSKTMELGSPSLLKCDLESKNVKHNSKAIVKESKVFKDGKASNDKTCDMETTCDNLTVLKSKHPVQSQTASLDPNDGLSHIAAGWTDEDESFFKEIGMSTETVHVNKTKNTKDESVKKLGSEDNHSSTSTRPNKATAMESIPYTGKAKPDTKHASKKLGMDSKIELVSSANGELDIKEFQTQDSAKSSSGKDNVDNDINLFPTPVDDGMNVGHEKSRSQEYRSRSQEEMEIDEFGSQLDSQLLCDDFEHLTPFKDAKR